MIEIGANLRDALMTIAIVAAVAVIAWRMTR